MNILKSIYKNIINMFNIKDKRIIDLVCSCTYLSKVINLGKNSDKIRLCFVAVF